LQPERPLLRAERQAFLLQYGFVAKTRSCIAGRLDLSLARRFQDRCHPAHRPVILRAGIRKLRQQSRHQVGFILRQKGCDCGAVTPGAVCRLELGEPFAQIRDHKLILRTASAFHSTGLSLELREQRFQHNF